MGITKHHLSKVGHKVTADIEAVRDMEAECIVYRRLLSEVIDTYIKELGSPMGDFDKKNYGLERAFRDGGAHHLKRLKEIVND